MTNSASRPIVSSESTDERTLHQDPLTETVTGSTPDPVRPELPSNDLFQFFVCRSVSSWDEVTEILEMSFVLTTSQ